MAMTPSTPDPQVLVSRADLHLLWLEAGLNAEGRRAAFGEDNEYAATVEVARSRANAALSADTPPEQNPATDQECHRLLAELVADFVIDNALNVLGRIQSNPNTPVEARGFDLLRLSDKFRQLEAGRQYLDGTGNGSVARRRFEADFSDEGCTCISSRSGGTHTTERDDCPVHGTGKQSPPELQITPKSSKDLELPPTGAGTARTLPGSPIGVGHPPPDQPEPNPRHQQEGGER